MANHSSATEREQTPHISCALKQRARTLINNQAIDARDRVVIRYGLETNDPWLPDLVRRAEAGESIRAIIDAGLDARAS